MKKFIEWSLLFVLVVGGIGLWENIPLPCAPPLPYSLGQLDPRFNISKDEFLKDTVQAGSVWEVADGRTLFRYDPEAPFTINLIYDERQQRSIDAKKLEASREKTQTAQQSLAERQTQVLAGYEKEKHEYQTLLVSFDAQAAAYNAEVSRWNNQGGAPADVVSKLQDEQKSLKRAQRELETKRQSVNALAAQVNGFSKQQVTAVDQYNANVERFNQSYGNQTEEFDQGVYVGNGINIYQFDDEAHLRGVLSHELGHSLGIDHVANPQSILYPLMGEQRLNPLTLSEEDKMALAAVCHLTRWDILVRKVGFLRDLLVAKVSPNGN